MILYTITIIFINLYVFLYSWIPFKKSYPPLSFYFADPISYKFSDYSNYNVSVYSMAHVHDLKMADSVMIHINPQDLYLFLHGTKLIFHTKNENREKCAGQYEGDHFSRAFMFSIEKPLLQPIEICHRNLDYLKKLYSQRIFYKTFETLQQPGVVVDLIVKSFYRAKGYNKILDVFI